MKILCWAAVFLIFSIIMLVLVGYLIISRMPKNVVWIKGNIYISGDYDPKTKESLFSRIHLGVPNDFLNENIPIAIELSDGGKVRISEVTMNAVEAMENARISRSYSTITGYRGSLWPEDAVFFNVSSPIPNSDYRFYKYSFAFIENKLVGVILYGEGRNGFWHSPTEKQYVFPLKQNEIEAIFGEPDEIKMGRELPLPNW